MALWAGFIFAPAVIEGLLRGEGPEEEEQDGDGLVRWAFERIASFSAMPLQPVADIMDGLFTPDRRAFIGRSPTSRVITPVIDLLDTAAGLWSEDDDIEGKDVAGDLLALIGVGLHLPTGQLDVWVKNFWGNLRYDGPAQFAKDLVVRRREEE